MLNILLNAGTSPIIVSGYVPINTYVKKPESRGKSAKVKEISSFEASQRLNAENLIYPYLVGLFEGDGFFSVSKKNQYFQCEIGIELSVKDVQLIYKIKQILGVGKIGFRQRGKISMVYLRVRNKTHLIKYLLPIFDKYPLFSNKVFDYLRLKEVLLSDKILYQDLDVYTRPSKTLNSIESILNASYFSSWLVGYTEAEGCFSTYKIKSRSDYTVASFDISQTNGEILLNAIAKYLCLTTKVCRDETNNFKLKVSSVRSIENVVTFFKKAPVKLLGNKKLQYLLFIKTLRTIPRYNDKINLPIKY